MYPPRQRNSIITEKKLAIEARRKRLLEIAAKANSRYEKLTPTIDTTNSDAVETMDTIDSIPSTLPGKVDQSEAARTQSDVSSSIISSSLPDKFEWTKLDDFAKWMQQSDETRQRQERRDAELRVRSDLDKQMADIRMRKEREKRDNQEYARNMSIEVEQWKDYDRRVADERRRRAELEKLDRDEQLAFDQQRKHQLEANRRQEDQLLLERIEAELRKEQDEAVERRKRDRLLTKDLMKENEEDRLLKIELKKAQDADELKQLREYHAIIEKQEQERESELIRRVERQKILIKRMEENVTRMIQEKSNDDNIRALKQQAERDARAIDVERFKARKLTELTEDMRHTLDKQREEKEARKKEDAELKAIHARILELDTEKFRISENERAKLRRKLVNKYREQLDLQVASMNQRKSLDKDEMSRDEILLNRELIELVGNVLPKLEPSVLKS